MKKIILSTLVCLSVCGFSQAEGTQNQDVKALNDEVQRRADILQYQHNVIVTQADKDNIKKQVIIEKLRASDSGTVDKNRIESAIIKFEVNDPTDQRDLYIAYFGGGGGGAEPPK